MSIRKKMKRLKRGGVLVTLGAVFAISIGLRLSTMDFELVSAASASDPVPESTVVGPTSPIRSAMDEITMLRDRLLAREEELADRERAVEAAQILVEERLAELEATEIRLEALIQVSDTAAESDLQRLTEVYETMGPDQTAALFSQMDPNFAAGFLTRMSPAASAAIMAELDPAYAYSVSVVIATRNATAPTLDQPETDTES